MRDRRTFAAMRLAGFMGVFMVITEVPWARADVNPLLERSPLFKLNQAMVRLTEADEGVRVEAMREIVGSRSQGKWLTNVRLVESVRIRLESDPAKSVRKMAALCLAQWWSLRPAPPVSPADFASLVRTVGSSATRDPAGEVRVEAVKCLAVLVTDEVTSYLTTAVRDADPRVVMAALSAIGDLHVPLGSGLPGVRAALQHTHAGVRKASLHALGRLGGDVFPELVKLVPAGGETMGVEALCQLTLAGDPRLAGACVAWLSHPEEGISRTSIQYLGGLADQRWGPYLMTLSTANRSAAWKQTRMRALGSSRDPRAIMELTLAWRGSDPLLREAALEGLAAAGQLTVDMVGEAFRDSSAAIQQKGLVLAARNPQPEFIPLLERMAADTWRVPMWRAQAVEVLGEGGAEGLQALVRLAGSSEGSRDLALSELARVAAARWRLWSPEERELVMKVSARAVVSSHDAGWDVFDAVQAEAVSFLVALWPSASETLQAKIINRLVKFEDERALEVLVAAAGHPSASVSEPGMRGLRQMKGRALPVWRQWLAESSTRLRQAAIPMIWQWGSFNVDFQVLARLIRTDDDRHVRALAVQALGIFGDAQAVPVLREALGDADARVRQEALKALNGMNVNSESDLFKKVQR